MAETKAKTETKRDLKFQGEIDPTSMVHSPGDKIQRPYPLPEPIGGPGDPRSISPLAVDTPTEGTETPWRDTPPTNVSSVHETNNDQSPPTDPAANVEDCDAQPAVDVPPEGEPVLDARTPAEVFPPDRVADKPAGRAKR